MRPGFLIVAHAPLASAFKAAAMHLFPGLDARVLALDVLQNQDQQAVLARAHQMIASAGFERTLILADAPGATPYMAVNPLVDGTTVRMVAGLSVPMLWRTLSQPDLPLDELVERAMLGGRNGLAASAFTPPQHQYRRSLPDDLQNRHDQ